MDNTGKSDGASSFYEIPTDAGESLAISPNLEALLEHDERTRAKALKTSGPYSPILRSPDFASFDLGFAVHLPPPPRGNRRLGHDPDRTSVKSPVTVLSTPPSPNPYLNQPPKLPRLEASKVVKDDDSAPASATASDTLASHKKHRPADLLTLFIDSGSDMPDMPKSPASPTASRWSSTSNSRAIERRNSPVFRTYTTLPRVDRLFGKGRDIFSSQSSSRVDSREDPEPTALDHVEPSLPSESTWRVSAEIPSVNDQKKHQRSAIGGGRDAAPVLDTSSQRTTYRFERSKRPVIPHARSWHASASPSSPKLVQPFTNTAQPPVPSTNHLVSNISTDPFANWAASSVNARFDSFVDFSFSSSPDFPTAHNHVSTSPLAGLPQYRLSTGNILKRTPSTSSLSTTTAPATVTSLFAAPLSKTPTPVESTSSLNGSSTNSALQSARRTSSPMNRMRQSSPKPGEASNEPVPPTTNFLNAHARADLVRKSRKLAKVFGATPGASVFSKSHDEFQFDSQSSPIIAIPKRHRHSVASVSNFRTPTKTHSPLSPWPIPEGTQYWTASGRRHSTPNDFSFLHVDNNDVIDISPSTAARNDDDDDSSASRSESESPIEFYSSFIDLSDEDAETTSRGRVLPRSPSSVSLAPTFTVEEEEEAADRKRKRERLAKLHRFLGSRVPADLVLGVSASEDPSLPSPASATSERVNKLRAVCEDDTRKSWLASRRSSSAAPQSDGIERLKEDLNTDEKAIHVRRAHKMEKVFGVPPPQTLYTRQVVSVPVSPPRASSQPSSPSIQRNPNQSAYKGKTHRRLGTSDSTQQLIPPRSSESSGYESSPDVYVHYQHSLLSLHDIIDRDDRASLVELHRYLQGGASESPSQEFERLPDRLPHSPSIKSERRLSLPSSIITVSTADYSTVNSKPEPNDFQLRRRRAAKLAQFFGVDYKQIMHEVLESIEKGLEDERESGALHPEEAEVLLQKLRTLRMRRLEVTTDL